MPRVHPQESAQLPINTKLSSGTFPDPLKLVVDSQKYLLAQDNIRQPAKFGVSKTRVYG